METVIDISSMVQAVNQVLADGEPGNVSVEDFSNQTYTGYKPQFIIDAMNEAFGWGSWGFTELSNEVSEKLVISHVEVWLKGCDFRPTGWGQSRIITGNIGDAKKGAQTDAFKKALSYFSIGNKAYQGLVPAPPKENKNARQAQGQQSRNVPRQPSQPAPQPATNGHATDQQVESLRKLLEILRKPEPENIETLSYAVAKELIAQLSQEYRQVRGKQEQAPASLPTIATLRARSNALHKNFDALAKSLLKKQVASDEEYTEQDRLTLDSTLQQWEKVQVVGSQAGGGR